MVHLIFPFFPRHGTSTVVTVCWKNARDGGWGTGGGGGQCNKKAEFRSTPSSLSLSATAVDTFAPNTDEPVLR